MAGTAKEENKNDVYRLEAPSSSIPSPSPADTSLSTHTRHRIDVRARAIGKRAAQSRDPQHRFVFPKRAGSSLPPKLPFSHISDIHVAGRTMLGEWRFDSSSPPSLSSGVHYFHLPRHLQGALGTPRSVNGPRRELRIKVHVTFPVATGFVHAASRAVSPHNSFSTSSLSLSLSAQIESVLSLPSPIMRRYRGCTPRITWSSSTKRQHNRTGGWLPIDSASRACGWACAPNERVCVSVRVRRFHFLLRPSRTQLRAASVARASNETCLTRHRFSLFIPAD